MLGTWLLTGLALAADGPAYLGADVDRGTLAARDVFAPDGADDPNGPDVPSVDCGYAGHEGPLGVALVLYEVGRPPRRWVIYDTARTAADCTPHATSTARLAEAKAAITAAGIDLDAPSSVAVADGDQLTLPRAKGPLRLTWTHIADARTEELDRRAASQHEIDGSMGGSSWSTFRYDLDGSPWRTETLQTMRWPSYYGRAPTAGVADDDQLLLLWASTDGGMRSATTTTYDLVRYELSDPPHVDRPRLDLPAVGSVRDVIVQDLEPSNGVAAVKLVYQLDTSATACDYPGMDHGHDGVLLTVWSFADGSAELAHEVYPPAEGQRGCASAAQATRVLAEAKESAASYGLDPTKGGPVRHPLGEAWAVDGHEVRLDGAVVRVDGSEVGRLPAGADVHSAWSHRGHLVFVLRKSAGTVVALSPLFPLGS